MQDDIFRRLGLGASFNSRKFGKDISVFRKGSAAPAHTAVPAASLDFFGNDKAASAPQAVQDHTGGDGEQRAGKRKRPRSAASARRVEHVSSGEDSEGGDDSSLVHESEGSDGSDGSDAGRRSPAPLSLFAAGVRKRTGSNSSDSDEDGGGGSDDDDDDSGVAAAGGKAAAAGADRSEQAIASFRRRLGISVQGSDVPPPMQTFEDMPAVVDQHIRRVLLANVEESAYKEPTPVQMQAVPAMALGRDVLAGAPTGSGKTAAFLLPLFARLKAPVKNHGVRALVLAPTRELAAQIHREAERLSRGKKFRMCLLSKSTVAGLGAAADGSARGGSKFDVMFSTPLRLLAALQAGVLSLDRLQLLVLDEADKLLEMGFVEQVDEILAACPKAGLQRTMFSATIPPGVEELARSVLHDPVRIVIGVRNAGASTISQQLVFVGREQGKLLAMRQLIQRGLRPPVIVFVQSKERAQELFRELVYDGVSVDVLHADRTQAQRDAIVQRFRTGKIWMLIATDLVARGLDFKGVNCVINFDFPQSAVSYVHRIGRTGRAGRSGDAVTFFTESDVPMLRSIANVMRLSGCDVAEWMLHLKKTPRETRKRMERSAPKRPRISTMSAYDRKRLHNRKEARGAQQAKQQRRLAKGVEQAEE